LMKMPERYYEPYVDVEKIAAMAVGSRVVNSTECT
jgi:hypothetical protein